MACKNAQHIWIRHRYILPFWRKEGCSSHKENVLDLNSFFVDWQNPQAFVQEAFVSLGGWDPCFRNPLPLLTSERELVSGVRKDLKQVFEKETIKSHLKRERDKRTGYSWKRRFYLKDSWARKKTSHKIHSYRKNNVLNGYFARSGQN